MLLFFIRHGDPVYSPDSLTPLGRRQAEAVGRRLARYGLDEIFSSPMLRARETAQPAAELTKNEVQILPFTSESAAWAQMSVPRADGGRSWFFATEEVKLLFSSPEVRNSGDAWLELEQFRGGPIAEGFLRIQRETRAFLSSQGFEWMPNRGIYLNLNPPRPEKRVALFAHHGFGTAFLSAVMDIPYPQVCVKLGIAHTGLTVIHFGEDEREALPRLLALSDCGHLLADNLPERYENWLYF